MSDEEYDYDYGSDAEEYNYGSDAGSECEEGSDDELIEIENSFYEADDIRGGNPSKAVELFEKVVDLETNRGDEVKWRFKALQHLVTLYLKTGNNEKMISCYKSMLGYMTNVSRNELTDAINIILDTLQTATQTISLTEMYEITLEALKSANNERLWFNTNLKLANLYMSMNKIADVERILLILKSACQLPDGSDDVSKATHLLEVYCLEIQLCTVTENALRMREVYPKTVNLNAAVSDPRIMGVIREEGGKMYMIEGRWMEAFNELFEAFRAFQQVGNVKAKSCLKYVALASMLAASDINPFSAAETKAFKDDVEIKAMLELRRALDTGDLRKFERTIRDKRNGIVDEPFLMTHIGPLRQKMQEQALLSITARYHRVSLSHLAKELSLADSEVEKLLVDMILDEKLVGAIDQIDRFFVCHDDEKGSTKNNLIHQYATLEGNISEKFHSRNT